MSGDSKIGMQIGGVVRMLPLRKVAGSLVQPAGTAARTGATDVMPAAKLIRLAGDLAAQPAPVDTARVAELRSAIAEGRYTFDPDSVAAAMLGFHCESAG